MIYGLYAVEDAVAGTWHPPFIALTPGQAERMISDMVASNGHPYNLHPDDYYCWVIGSFDDAGGDIWSSKSDERSRLFRLSQCVRKSE